MQNNRRAAEDNSLFIRGERRHSLVNAFLRKTIPPCPKGALGARSSFRIVNAFFMRTANDAVCHHYRLDTARLDHRQNPLADALVETHIGSLRAETLQNFGFCPFGAENSHG